MINNQFCVKIYKKKTPKYFSHTSCVRSQRARVVKFAFVCSLLLPKNRSIFITANGALLDKSIARAETAAAKDGMEPARCGAVPRIRKRNIKMRITDSGIRPLV